VPLPCIDMCTVISRTWHLHSVPRRRGQLSLSTELPQDSVSNVNTPPTTADNDSVEYDSIPASTDCVRNHRYNTAPSRYVFYFGASLTADTYVILITGRESVGHLTSHEIWRLTKFEIVPLRLGKGNAIQVSQTFQPF
jgi:hypothetical protein